MQASPQPAPINAKLLLGIWRTRALLKRAPLRLASCLKCKHICCPGDCDTDFDPAALGF